MISRRTLIRSSQYYRFWAGWGEHVFFQTRDGDLHGAGKNSTGQLSVPTSLSVHDECGFIFKPYRVALFCQKKMRVKTVALGVSHSLFITEHSGAFSSGENDDGRLSDGTKDDRNVAVPIVLVVLEMGKECEEKDSRTISKAFAGYYCSFFVTSKGCVYSAGYNFHGLLGHGFSLTNVLIARKVKALPESIVEIATAKTWAIFRCKSGKMFGCGVSKRQFDFFPGEKRVNEGSDTCSAVRIPIEIEFFKTNRGVEFMFNCFDTTFFATGKRQVFVMGNNSFGQFGIMGSTQSSNVPLLSPELSNFEIFAFGKATDFSVFKKNGKVYATGQKHYCGHPEVDHPIDYHSANIDVSINSSDAVVVELEYFRGKNVKQIVTRDRGTYVICGNGEVYSTGDAGALLIDSHEKNSREFQFVGKFDLMLNNPNRCNEERLERIRFLYSRFRILTVICCCI